MARPRQTILLILIGITGLFLPLSCVPILLLVPYGFYTSFRIENQSGQALEVSPVGTWGPKGNKALLPLWPGLKRRHFSIKPGESLGFTYDMDDLNFSEIVVRTRGTAGGTSGGEETP